MKYTLDDILAYAKSKGVDNFILVGVNSETGAKEFASSHGDPDTIAQLLAWAEEYAGISPDTPRGKT